VVCGCTRCLNARFRRGRDALGLGTMLPFFWPKVAMGSPGSPSPPPWISPRHGSLTGSNEHGVSDFEALRSAIRSQPQRLIFCAFDLLHSNGKDLRDLPLLERRAKLKELVPSGHPFLFSEEFTGDAAAFFRACADRQLEGIVSKLASSKYRSGRSKTWLKTKCFTEGPFVIIGTDRDRKTGAHRALLAKAGKQGLAYAGAAFFAVPGDTGRDLFERLRRLSATHSPIAGLRLKDAKWVRPEVTARVRHLVGASHLRHATVRTIE
jgi:bifunctional non-homologous end joining protein LigD